MKDFFISIIIPCYNVEHYVEKCVESIFNNNYDPLELILINDGSTDNTLEKVTKLKQIYSSKNIVLVNQENKGLSESRNIGVELASGEYLMFIDSDDWISENYFKTFISKMIKGIDLVFASYTREFEYKSVPRILKLSGIKEASFVKRRLIGLINEELNDPSQADSIVTVWSKLYRKEIIKRNGVKFVSTKTIGTAEDLLFNLDYIQFCNSVLIVDEPLYHYRKDNVSSFTKKYRGDLFNKWQILFSKIEVTIDRYDIQMREAFTTRICLSIIGLGLNEINNPKGILEINKNLKMYLSTPRYKNAFEVLNYKYFPMHWKIFFLFAKYKITLGLYVMLKLMNKIINK